MFQYFIIIHPGETYAFMQCFIKENNKITVELPRYALKILKLFCKSRHSSLTEYFRTQ